MSCTQISVCPVHSKVRVLHKTDSQLVDVWSVWKLQIQWKSLAYFYAAVWQFHKCDVLL